MKIKKKILAVLAIFLLISSINVAFAAEDDFPVVTFFEEDIVNQSN